jgi:hypothetical protein
MNINKLILQAITVQLHLVDELIKALKLRLSETNEQTHFQKERLTSSEYLQGLHKTRLENKHHDNIK